MNEQPSLENLSLDGGTLCFNFINTVTTRTENYDYYDYLKSYEDLLSWCRKTKTLSNHQIETLKKVSSENQKKTAQIFLKIKKSRELLYRFFSKVAVGSTPIEKDLMAFNDLLSNSLSLLAYKKDNEKLTLHWKIIDTDLKAPLWHIIKSAHDILSNAEKERIKQCEACGWIFLDQSRNKSRRWCSMQVCGSIHKSKKYYYKKKNQSDNEK